jgi:hypothetical protein
MSLEWAGGWEFLYPASLFLGLPTGSTYRPLCPKWPLAWCLGFCPRRADSCAPLPSGDLGH